MESRFEELLKNKTKDQKSEILYSQWMMVKKNAPKILQVICDLFPHYSLHEESHSQSILNNVYKIMGPDVAESLTEIDVWLLLNSAYLHDIGMVFFADEKADLLKKDEFVSFVDECKKNNDFSIFANQFKINDSSLEFFDNNVSVEKFEALKFLLAEFVRKKHSARSKEKILSESCLYELFEIPNRIVKTLAKICEVHAKPFNDVMKLRDVEDGIWEENCHPRFVACLLRLGDVLDLDNNRISFIQSQTIKTIPTDSFFHRLKHFAIDHKQIDCSAIEFSATCEEYETAELASSWFNMIDDEFISQMKNWNKIKPSELKFSLPQVGSLNVNLLNGWESFDGKKQPAFSIKPEKALEYLQGAGIYRDKFQSLREILQNAVDATFLRLWIESKDNSDFSFFQQALKNYPIDVSVKRSDDESDPNYNIINIEIRDFGLGMSKEDVKFLEQTGSSSEHQEKRKIIKGMPEWMKPSGTFGIGFQSIFLLVDEVNIESRKIYSDKKVVVKAFSSNTSRHGVMYVKLEEDVDFKVGTKISFKYKTKKIPDAISYSFDSLAERAVLNYDFVENDCMDYDYGKILDEIYTFACTSYVPLNLSSDLGIELLNGLDSMKWDYFSEKNNLRLKFYPDGSGVNVFYRNQLAERRVFGNPFAGFSIDVLKDSAEKVLSLNRNKVRKDYKSSLFKSFLDAVCDFVDDASFDKYAYTLPRVSALLLCEGVEKEKVPLKCRDEWKNYTFEVLENDSKKEYTIDALFKQLNRVYLTNVEKVGMERIEKTNNELNVLIYYRSDLEILIKNISSLYFDSIKYNKGTIVFQKEEEYDIIDSDSWINWFDHIYKSCWYKRNVMPCNLKYRKLALVPNPPFPYAFDITFGAGWRVKGFEYNLMICPFVLICLDKGKKLKVAITDELVEKTYENRLDKNVTKQEIRDTYTLFVDDMKKFGVLFE